MSQAGELEARFRPLLNFFARYMNAHRFLWLMSLLCFLIAWNRGIALLYGLLALMLALILVSWVMPWWALRHLTLNRVQQGQAVAGQTLRLHYRFHCRKPVFFLRIREALESDGGTVHFLPGVSDGDEVTLSYVAPMRGIHFLPAPVISCAWPFGFVERHCYASTDEARLVVMPKTFRIRNLPLPVSNNPLPVGADSSLNRSAHSEFAGVRPHRDGDSLRHVHWAASARQQQLVVREFHSFDSPSWLVLVDGQQGAALGEGADSTFEFAVQIAASLLLYAQSQQLKLTLVVSGKKPLILHMEAGVQDVSDYLQALAWVKDDGDEDYQSLINRTLAARQDSPLVVTVRRDSKALTLPAGFGHIDVVYNDVSFSQPLARYDEGWHTPAPGVQQLKLHRLSKLHQVFAS